MGIMAGGLCADPIITEQTVHERPIGFFERACGHFKQSCEDDSGLIPLLRNSVRSNPAHMAHPLPDRPIEFLVGSPKLATETLGER